MCLDMMEFEGIDKMREKVQQGQTLMNLCQQLALENAMLKAAAGVVPAAASSGGSNGGGTATPAESTGGGSSGLASAVNEAMQPMTSYGQRLAERSKPDMNAKSSAAKPGN